MVQRQDIEIHGFSFLRYRQQRLCRLLVTHSISLAFGTHRIWPQSETGRLMERFLHWLSAHGSGTWEHFRQASQVLGDSFRRTRR